jgi:hypothetical protein
MQRMTRDQLKQLLTTQPVAKTSKYCNQKVVCVGPDGTKFKVDSKREAQRWTDLMLRFKAGEITRCELQVRFKIEVTVDEPVRTDLVSAGCR